MSEFVKRELQLEHRFDQKTCRHTINGITAVLHCHHFATLTTQLANDCGLLDGKKLLADCAEDAFYQVLSSYYKEHSIQEIGTYNYYEADVVEYGEFIATRTK
ncbi:hypothetical protein LQZ19_18440 [Treponema primitia]|uniref:hypothetical protein n=1 Tax=Treponema primitia TaxID=88058 RepID=UPI0039811C16